MSLHYGLSWQKGPEADRHIFRRRDGAPLVGGKWADCIANFPATINLQYEIAGAELSRPKAAHYCFILLVSYYQQSQSTPTAPHTQSRFYITSIRRCTNAENIWRQPWELCFLRGWEGLLERRGPSAGPLRLFPGLGSSDTMRATCFLLRHIPTTFYEPQSEMFTDEFEKLSTTAFRCERRCRMYASGACGMSLITWMYTSNCATSSPRCSASRLLSTSSYERSRLRLFTSLSVE